MWARPEPTQVKHLSRFCSVTGRPLGEKAFCRKRQQEEGRQRQTEGQGQGGEGRPIRGTGIDSIERFLGNGDGRVSAQ